MQYRFIYSKVVVSTGPKFPARPANFFVLLSPELLQNLYNGLDILGGGGKNS